MKVLHITGSVSSAGGGVSKAILELAEYQARAGIEVDICGLSDDYIQDSQHDLPVKHFPIQGPKMFGYSNALKQYISQNISDVDILHSHGLWIYPGCAAAQLASSHNKPLIISPHGMLDPWALNNSAWKKKMAAAAFENKNLELAKCVHALCNSEFKSIRDYGLKNPVCVIPNGVIAPGEKTSSPPPWTDNDKKALLFLGRLHPKKGLAPLINALDGLDDSWILIVGGWNQGSHRRELEELIEKLNLSERIVLTGALQGDDKISAFQNANAFILPSFSEGLPVTVLEAWSYGLPTLITQECNLPEGLEAGAAIEIEPEADSIRNGLRKLCAMSDTERAEIGEKGRLLATEQFSWSNIAEQMKMVYDWIMDQGTRPPCLRED